MFVTDVKGLWLLTILILILVFHKDESRVVWKVLGALRAIMNDLTTLVSQAPATNNAVHSTRSPEVPLDLFLWVHSKLVHPENRILLDGLMHRWMEEAMRLKKIEEGMIRRSSYVHPLVLRSGWKALDQAGFDILSMARMVNHTFGIF